MTDETHIVIVGCGRVGAGLASRLNERGHSVTVIDIEPTAFRRLGALNVETIVGVGYDRDTLRRAGVEHASAVGAVTSGDNTNIVVARTARERFRVPRTFARIYDPRRALIYERLGIPTIASASITVDLALRFVDPDVDGATRWLDPSGRAKLVEREVATSIVGRRYMELDQPGRARIALVRRLGAAVLPTPDLIAQEGDVVYVMVDADEGGGIDALLALPKDRGHA
jgi:trk system potassium uptake protein TrkA